MPEGHPRRRGAIHLIIKLAHRSEQLPPSLFHEDIVLRHDAEYQCGGFGDVYRGTVDGQPVAIKKPRMFEGDEHAKKVRSRLSASALLMTVVSDCVARHLSGASSSTSMYCHLLA
jgi:hypothetical protein